MGSRSSSRPRRPAWQRYGVALLLASAVIVGRVALDPLWGYQHNRHLVLLPMVLLAAWLGGFYPGLVAATLATFSLAFFWTMPPHAWWEASSLADLGLFFALSVAICALIQSLHTARARADAATAARERLLAIVAHDLRNRLATIQLASAGLRRELDAEPLRDTTRGRLRSIDRAVVRVERLIRDLVDTTQIEHGELRMDLERARVEPIVREVTEAFLPLAEERGIHFEAGPAPDAAIVADRNRLVQVLENLIGNALKFTPMGGRIRLRTLQDGREVRFEVEDTGPGIKFEHLSHLFEAYWTTSESHGTGLGLFIAQRIVSEHGGRIDVSTAPGRGATFSFGIPRVE